MSHYEQYGIEQLHIPTVDYTPPALEDIDRACEFIRRFAQAGQSVYSANPRSLLSPSRPLVSVCR